MIIYNQKETRTQDKEKKMKDEMIKRIYTLLKNSDLSWHGWMWWGYKDEWFKQFDPKEIDKVALEMADLGMIETNIERTGFRRKEKTRKENFWITVMGYKKDIYKAK